MAASMAQEGPPMLGDAAPAAASVPPELAALAWIFVGLALFSFGCCTVTVLGGG